MPTEPRLAGEPVAPLALPSPRLTLLVLAESLGRYQHVPVSIDGTANTLEVVCPPTKLAPIASPTAPRTFFKEGKLTGFGTTTFAPETARVVRCGWHELARGPEGGVKEDLAHDLARQAVLTLTERRVLLAVQIVR